MAVGRGLQDAQRQLIHLQRGLLHVALGPHVVPLAVVERQVGLHRQDHRTVSHIKGEGDHGGSLGEEGGWGGESVGNHTHTHTYAYLRQPECDLGCFMSRPSSPF